MSLFDMKIPALLTSIWASSLVSIIIYICVPLAVLICIVAFILSRNIGAWVKVVLLAVIFAFLGFITINYICLYIYPDGMISVYTKHKCRQSPFVDKKERYSASILKKFPKKWRVSAIAGNENEIYVGFISDHIDDERKEQGDIGGIYRYSISSGKWDAYHSGIPHRKVLLEIPDKERTEEGRVTPEIYNIYDIAFHGGDIYATSEDGIYVLKSGKLPWERSDLEKHKQAFGMSGYRIASETVKIKDSCLIVSKNDMDWKLLCNSCMKGRLTALGVIRNSIYVGTDEGAVYKVVRDNADSAITSGLDRPSLDR